MRRALLSAAAAALLASPAFAQGPADDIDRAVVRNGVAVLQALDKVTARVTPLEVAVGDSASFGTLDIVVRACQERPPEAFPESAAYLEIFDRRVEGGGEGRRVFDGWMFASSPALSALEHAVYDVWVEDCREPIENG